MPGSATTYTEQAVLGHTLAFAPMTPPSGVFVALCLATAPPTAGTAGTEVVGGAYTRMATTFALLTSPNNIAANLATIEFPTATAPWGSLGYFEVWSALTGGNRLYWGPLVDPSDGVTPIIRTVQTGDIVRFTAGVIQVKAT
jgi:hypothetical protein